MNQMESFIPFLDLIFLTLLSMLAIFSETSMDRMEAVNVELVTVGQGAEPRDTRPPTILTLTRDGALFLGRERIEAGVLKTLPANRPLVLRADAGVSYERVLRTLDEIKKTHREVLLEVRRAGEEEKS